MHCESHVHELETFDRLKELGTRTGWPRDRNERLLDRLEGRSGAKGIVRRDEWVRSMEEKMPHDSSAFCELMKSFVEV